MAEWELAESREIRDRLLELSDRHEEEEHGGEPCLSNRVSHIAFLMHALGVGADNLPLLLLALQQYERQPDSRNGREHL